MSQYTYSLKKSFPFTFAMLLSYTFLGGFISGRRVVDIFPVPLSNSWKFMYTVNSAM